MITKGSADTMLEIIYTSFRYSEKIFERTFENSKQKPSQVVQKYNRLMAEGLARHKDINVSAVCEMPIMKSDFFIKKRRKI